jgi:hypothetical protein
MPDAYITLLLENCTGGQPQITGYSTIVSNSYQFVADSNGAINGTVWANDQISCSGTIGATIYAQSLYDPNGNQIGTTQCFAVLHTQGAWNINSQQPVACGTTPPNPTNGTYGNLNSTGFFQANNGAYSGTLTVGGSVIGHSTLDLPLTGGALSGALSGPAINNVAFPTNLTGFQSAVTACGSNDCTIGVNANIVFATNYAVPSNVTLTFANGGQLQPNTGITLTLNGPIQAAPVQIFGGAGTVVLSALVASAPVQWWGAVADSDHLGSTGTDNTAAIQGCLSGIAPGAECFLSAGDYKITGALLINRSEVSIRGTGAITTYTPAWTTPHPSRIVTTSPTADIIDLWGSNTSSTIVDNRIRDLTLTRGVIPTSPGPECGPNGNGISMKYNYAAIVDSLTVEDSGTGIYFKGVGASAKGYLENIDVIWGSNGLTESSGVYCGYYEDSIDGTASPSLRIRNSDAQAPQLPYPHPSLRIYGFAAKGMQMSDIHAYHLEMYLVDYGISLIGVGMNGFAQATDIWFENSILDNIFTSGIQIVDTSGFGTFNFTDNWIYMNTSNANPAVDLDTSASINLSNSRIYSPNITAPVIRAVNGGSEQFVNNQIIGGTAGAITLDNTPASVITGNSIVNQGGSWGTDVIKLINGSSFSTISDNSISGGATNGITIDNLTNGTGGLETNSIGDPALGTITNILNVSASNFTPIYNGIRIGLGSATMTSSQGNGALVQHSTGAFTLNDCVKFDASGNTVDSGSACGGGGSGVASINTVTGAFTFTGSGVSCTSTTCTFSGTGSGMNFNGLTSGTNTAAAMLVGTGASLGTTGSGTIAATSLTGNIPESQVTNLTTDLAAKVATTTTVNGHALSANVTVSASDLTTGTLPHGQLPALVSGDIPNNAANTSGTSAGLTGSPSITVTACTGCTAAQYKVRNCSLGMGDGTNAIPAGTYTVNFQCRNLYGVTYTITGVQCASDNNGTSTANVADSASNALLTGAFTTTNTWASGTQSAHTTLSTNVWTNWTIVADGTSKQIQCTMTGTI